MASNLSAREFFTNYTSHSLYTDDEITLKYGPIYVEHVWRYSYGRCKNLVRHLQELGLSVKLIRIQPRNRFVVLLNGNEVFRCRYTFIKYYKSSKANYILEKIMWAVMEAKARDAAIRANFLSENK